MSLYKMKFEFSRQSWYNSEGVYELVEKHVDRYMNHIGTDCTWKNVLTGELVNNWDHVMTPLTKSELRQFNLNLVVK